MCARLQACSYSYHYFECEISRNRQMHSEKERDMKREDKIVETGREGESKRET